MNGGPSQMDTFDLKPGTKNGGPFREMQTSAPGLRISEHLPKLAQHGHRMAVVRSMSTKEAEHGRATFVMRTGYNPTGPIQYPGIGSLLSKELGSPDAPLPNCVAIAPNRFLNPAAYGPGFLGPLYAPLIVGDNIQLGPRRPARPPASITASCSRSRTWMCPTTWTPPTPTPGSTSCKTWRATSSGGIPAWPRRATRRVTTGPSS